MDVDDPNSSPSLSTSTEGSLKRKERDHGEEQQAAGEQKEGEKEIAELTSDTSVEAAAAPPKKKKAKNTLALVKKVAVWKDIKKWKEGDDPLGRFPIEILDQASPPSICSPPLHLIFLRAAEAESLTFFSSCVHSDHLHRL